MLLFPSELGLQVKQESQRIICKATVQKHICSTIPTEARFDLLIRFRIYCDPECRICFSHLAGIALLTQFSEVPLMKMS